MRPAKIKLTAQQQQQLAKEFNEDYGIEIERFDEESGEPSFTFEQLQKLAFCLCPDIVENQVEPGFCDLATGEVEARTIFQVKNGPRVTRTGKARINQQLRNGETIEDEAQAMGLAKLNSFRDALRAIGFNPLSVHRARRAGVEPPPVDSTGTADVAGRGRELHALANEAGLIVRGDYTGYRKWLLERFGVNTSAALNAEQIALACQSLRSDLAITHYQLKKAA